MAKRKRKRKMSEQVRDLIDGCGISRYELSKRTGIAQSTLARFMSKERALSQRALDAIGEELALEVISRHRKRS